MHTFYLRFSCEGAASGITEAKYASVHQNLIAGQWNHVVWEFSELKRDKVTNFRIIRLGTGYDSGIEEPIVYDFDRLELERVKPDPYEGWDLPDGKFAFSHAGYKPGDVKQAILNENSSKIFGLVNSESGETVLKRPVRAVSGLGHEYSVLDFSDVREPGRYRLKAGDMISNPFVIADTVWRQPLYKALNFFYCLRCGYDVPGVHNVCHGDWQCTHEA